jgi:uncharacterized tellurite resistance protein B-like protein
VKKCPKCGKELPIPADALQDSLADKVKNAAGGAWDLLISAAGSVGDTAKNAGADVGKVAKSIAGKMKAAMQRQPARLDFKTLPEEQQVAVYGCLFALAGADGEIEKEEAASIFETLETDGMSDCARHKIHSFLHNPPPLEEHLELIANGPPELRFGLMVAMMEVALIDGETTEKEKELLQRVSEKLSITPVQVEAIEKFVRELQRLRARGIDDNAAVQGLKAAAAGLSAVGIPLAAVYFSGSVIGFSAAGITSGLAAVGLGFGMIPGIGVAILLGTGVFVGAKWLMDKKSKDGKRALQADRERRAQFAIKNLQDAIDAIISRLRDLQHEADKVQANEEAIRALTQRLTALQRLLSKRKAEAMA